MDQLEQEVTMQTAPLKLYLTEDFQEAARAFAEKTPARTFQGPLNPPARGRYGILLSLSATRLSRRDVVERERIVMVEPRRTGMSMSREAAVVFERLRPIGAFTPSDPTLQCIAKQE